MSSLADREKQILLDVARRALIAAVERCETLENPLDDPHPLKSSGVFVTMHRRGKLRGCIGQIGSHEPLFQTVAYCAKAAALEDPRFEPVQPNELAEIDIELSILSPPEEVAPEQIEVGRHGLILSKGWQRGVLLPQVATQFGWTAPRFLEETCVKAGLERDAWRDAGTLIHAFTAEIFSESEFRSPRGGRPEAPGGAKPRYSTSM
jgi:AmmeMemoRadiSam system protein A